LGKENTIAGEGEEKGGEPPTKLTEEKTPKLESTYWQTRGVTETALKKN